MCAYCLGVSAALYCEQCLDSYCSSCYASLHKGGRLALHTCFEVEQPPGFSADQPLLVSAPTPEEAVASAVSVGSALVERVHLQQARGVSAAEGTEGMTPAQVQYRELQVKRALLQHKVYEERVSLGDVARYLARCKRMGSLPTSMLMKVTLQPKEAVLAAAQTLLTEEAAQAVGGWGVLKHTKPDGWMSGVTIRGSGMTLYK
jgi:hypothetical protein